MHVDDDPCRADLMAVHDEPCRNKLERNSSMRHAIRPSLAEAPTPLESLGIHRLLHQVCARANFRRRLTATYRGWARTVAFEHPHTAKALNILADHYEFLAQREDEDAERLDWA